MNYTPLIKYKIGIFCVCNCSEIVFDSHQLESIMFFAVFIFFTADDVRTYFQSNTVENQTVANPSFYLYRPTLR